ncbi:MAG: minor capsid protein [Clostridiales bacterium]
MQGKSVQELSRQFSDEAIGKDFYKCKPKGTLKKAQRLVRTETAFILNQATSDMYNELGVDEYEFLGTLDSKTCEHCGGLDGKHYVSDEKKIGINYPPMHPWCRCTTVPYFPEDEDEDIGQRIARGADGKKYYVPADITYEEWKNELKRDAENGIIKTPNKYHSKAVSTILSTEDIRKRFKSITFDKSFDTMDFSTQKEIAQGFFYMQKRFGDKALPQRCAAVNMRYYGKTDGFKITFKKNLEAEEVFLTACHECVHVLDLYHGEASTGAYTKALRSISLKKNAKELDILKYEILGASLFLSLKNNLKELMAYSFEKELQGNGNKLSKKLVEEFTEIVNGG